MRSAVDGDRDAVWPLALDFATTFAPERSAFEASFAAVIHAPDALLAVALAGGELIGYLLAHRHSTFLANGPVAWTEEVMVVAHARRRGTGTALMAAAERWAAEGGCAYTALASRRAGDFHRALGYEDSATFFRKLLDR